MYECIIYKATNKVNGKCYVGQTICYERRKRDHLSSAFNENSHNYKNYFQASIRKYGEDSFSWAILERKHIETPEESKEWMNEREIFYIEKFNSFNRKFGYNMTKGGEGTVGVLGELNPTSKKVGQYSLDGELIKVFAATMEANRDLGISFKNISLCCKGERRQAGGYFWMYEPENGEFPVKIDPIRECDTVGKEIYAFKYDTGDFVASYKSSSDASKILGLTAGQIGTVLQKKVHSTGGYIFRYADSFLRKNHPTRIKVTKKPKKFSPVVQFTLDGKYITEYTSIDIAFAETGCMNITKCCNRLPTHKHAGGYLWIYKEEYDAGERPEPYKNPSYFNPVVRLNKDYTLAKEYESFSEAAKDVSKNIQSIINYCRGVQKPRNSPYIWMLKKDFLEYGKEKTS